MKQCMKLFGFDSFSFRYISSVSTEICSLNRAAKFVMSVLHCISTEQRKLCWNIGGDKE